MAKSTTRIVIKDSDLPLVESLKTLTGVSSGSEVMSLLLSRYGAHFEQWFRFDSRHCNYPGGAEMPQLQTPAIAPQEPTQNFEAFEL